MVAYSFRVWVYDHPEGYHGGRQLDSCGTGKVAKSLQLLLNLKAGRKRENYHGPALTKMSLVMVEA